MIDEFLTRELPKEVEDKQPYKHEHKCKICKKTMLYYTTLPFSSRSVCSKECEGKLGLLIECYICGIAFQFDPKNGKETCPGCRDHVLAD